VDISTQGLHRGEVTLFGGDTERDVRRIRDGGLENGEDSNTMCLASLSDLTDDPKTILHVESHVETTGQLRSKLPFLVLRERLVLYILQERKNKTLV